MKEYIVQEETVYGRHGPYEILNTANKVELIRCKDCKHWYFADNRIPSEQENVCERNGIVVTPDWFCADGERQEGW